MNTSEVLDRAADEIERRGWTQGGTGWFAGARGLCLEGALAAVVNMDASVDRDAFKECPAYLSVWNYLKGDGRWGMYRHSLYNWNDEPARTQEDVIEVLRAAAMVERTREAADERVSS